MKALEDGTLEEVEETKKNRKKRKRKDIALLGEETKVEKENNTSIMRTFCNVPIDTSPYKSTSEMRTPLY